MPLFWSEKRTTVEWLAAQLRDMAMMPPDKAMQAAEADYAKEAAEATNRAVTFAAYIETLTGIRGPRRVGNWH